MERIQKLIAKSTSFSRRKVEELIKAGRITLNNAPAQLGDKATPDDKITIDGKVINLHKFQNEQTRVLLLNKKVGYVCSKKDDKNRPSVFELLPKDDNWIMVGRLDINTSGLLLFTNSGDLAHKLMHPSSNIDREYAVRILGKVRNEDLSKLQQGVQLEEGIAKFKRILFIGGEGANTWYQVVIGEGRNREVRRLWGALGFQVSRLIRTRFADIRLPKELRANEIIELKPGQVNNLKARVNL